MRDPLTARVGPGLNGPRLPKGAHPPCRGHVNVFFAPAEDGRVRESKAVRQARVTLAKAICGTCGYRSPCLEHAMRAREPWGVWGGLDENDRRLLRLAAS